MRLRATRREFLTISAAASAALLVGSSGHSGGQLFAQDPKPKPNEWATFRNGPANLGIAAGTLPASPKLLWEVAAPDGVPSTPVIADQEVYVGTLSGDLLCLDLATGSEKWKYRTLEKEAGNTLAPGFRAPLALSTDAVFGGDDMGTFHAVDRKSGKKLWTVATNAEIVGGAQIAAEGKVIFGSHDGHLYCRQAKDGKPVWKAETRGPVNATPCLAGDFTFTTGCDQPILRVFDIKTGQQASEVPLDSLLLASAAVREDILYFGSDDGTVFALDWRKKEAVWQFAVPGREQQMQSSPAVTDALVIIGSRDKFLYAIDRRSGELRWSFQTRARIDSSPVVVGDRVFFGCSDKNLYALALADGKEVWKYPTQQPVTGSPAVASGKLVIGTESTGGRILCFG